MEVETSGVHSHLNDRSRICSCVQSSERGFMARSARAHVSASDPDSSPVVYSDSQSVVALSKNPVHHNASKHIEVRYGGVSNTSV